MGDAGVVDLLITGRDADDDRWELFIENKIDASESPGQTRGYLEACRSRLGDRAAGIFLTLDGRAARAEEGVTALSHRDLARWVEQNMQELTDPVLRVAAESYVRRALAPPPTPRPEQRVGDLLGSAEGLQRWDAGLDVLGREIVAATAPGWSHTPLWIQGPAQGNPGLQFHREGWWGTPIEQSKFSRRNRNVHAELELVPEALWRLKIHFETEPYMTRKQLAQEIENREEFEAMREVFRKAVHERASELPGWKMTNYRLQVCSLQFEISMESRVEDAVRGVAEGLRAIGKPVDEALVLARSPQA